MAEPRDRRPPDLLLTLDRTRQGYELTAWPRAPESGRRATVHLGTLDGDRVDGVIADVRRENLASPDSDEPRARSREQAMEWGARLWELLPRAFRDRFYWEQVETSGVRTVQVLSSDVVFPWEMAIPADRGGAPTGAALRDLLGLKYAFAHWWTRGAAGGGADPDVVFSGIPSSISIGAASVFVGPDISPKVRSDTRIEDFFGVHRIDPGCPAQFRSLVGAAGSRAIDVLAHGTSSALHLRGLDECDEDEADLCAESADCPDATDIDLHARHLAEIGTSFSSPTLVVLHACRSGANRAPTGGAGGAGAGSNTWPSVLVDRLRCEALVAPFFESEALASLRFACRLYPLLQAGSPIAEAVTTAKGLLEPDLLPGASYQVFGATDATVTFTMPLNPMLADCSRYTWQV